MLLCVPVYGRIHFVYTGYNITGKILLLGNGLLAMCKSFPCSESDNEIRGISP